MHGFLLLTEYVTECLVMMKACLIGYMESIAIGKNLAATNGYDIDAGQEMLALGIANVVGATWL